MKTRREQLAERVAKVLAMKKSSFEGEVFNATDLVHDLLIKYDLTMDEVERAAQGTICENFARTEPEMWRRQVATMAANLYFCSYLFATEPGKTDEVHLLVGRPTDVSVAVIMVKYIWGAILNEADRASDQVLANLFDPERRAKYRESFIATCAARVSQRINQRIVETVETARRTAGGNRGPGKSTALAVVSLYEQFSETNMNWVRDKIGDVKMQDFAQIPTVPDMAGAIDGFVSGDRIGLDPQIERREG